MCPVTNKKSLNNTADVYLETGASPIKYGTRKWRLLF